jgi:hypothetical protein
MAWTRLAFGKFACQVCEIRTSIKFVFFKEFLKLDEVLYSCSPILCEIDDELKNYPLNIETTQTIDELSAFERVDGAQSGETCSAPYGGQWKRADLWTTRFAVDLKFAFAICFWL